MAGSSVQIKVSKDLRSLKPIQPTHLWTFANALSLLKNCHDTYILDALDEFLLLNIDQLLNPSPFESEESGGTTQKNDDREVFVRNIVYTNLSSNSISDAEKISKILGLDHHDILRILSQTNDRIPEKRLYACDSSKSKLPDDRHKYVEDERLYLGASRVLREKRIVLRLVVELLNNKANSDKSSTVQNLGREIFLSEEYIEKLVVGIEKSVGTIVSKSYLDINSEALSELVYTESVLFLIDQLRLLVELLVQNPRISKTVMIKWYSFMGSTNFTLSLGPHIKFSETFELIQALSTVISVILLDMENDFATNDVISNYTNDPSVFKTINDAITAPENLNSVIMYSWSIILLRKSYILDADASSLQNKTFLSMISIQQIEKNINELTSKCINLDVFGDLARINKSLKFDNIYPAILTSVILSAIPLASLTPKLSKDINCVLKISPTSVVQKFFDNESATEAMILSRAKFPLSLTPFLQMGSINGNFGYRELSEMKSYLYRFDKADFQTRYEIDDVSTELIKLTSSVEIYPPYEMSKKLCILIESGTKAKILPSEDEKSILVAFLHDYNGWALLGRVLQNISKVFDNSDNDKVETIINILEITSRVMIDNTEVEANSALKYMSAYTDNSDIVEVIFRLFEQSLHSRSISISNSVLNFFTHSMRYIPSRIWSYLFKSSLFNYGGKEGFASVIFGAIEMVNGEYSFTLSLAKFADSLVKNCLTTTSEYPESSKEAILSRFINHLILVFESYIHCKFNRSYQKLELGVLILDIFSNILATVYGVDGGKDVSNKLGTIFLDPANRITSSFLVSGTEYCRTVHPILSMIDSLKNSINIYEVTDISGFWFDNWIRCSLAFSQLIISIRTAIDLPPSAFERLLFARLPTLVNIYSQYENLRKDTLELITALTNGKWPKDSTPSLLSHLGREYSQILLHSLASDLDNSFDDYRMKISLYDFICAVLEGNQEGLSVLFISGRDVFGDFTKQSQANDQNLKPISLLKILKKSVRDTTYYPDSVSLHLVDAISLAFNSWSTASKNDDDLEFVDELISKIDKPNLREPVEKDDYVSSCYNFKLASKISEILLQILFTSKNTTTQERIIKFVTSKSFIDNLVHLFTIHGYSPSLQLNVENDFKKFIPGFELADFTCSLLKRNRYGISSAYSIVLMDKLFADITQWLKLRERIIYYSINLQYLDAQISVIKSLGALVTAFCRRHQASLTTDYFDVVTRFLKTNASEGVLPGFLGNVFQERLELSFLIHYTLCTTQNMQNELRVEIEVVGIAAELLACPSVNFLQNIGESTGSYRPILRILFCALNATKNDIDLLVEHGSVLRNIFDLVITKATRNLLIEIQNDVYYSQTNKDFKFTKMNERLDDLLLILSILKVFMTMKSSSNLHYDMATLVNDNGTIKALLNLLSLAHLFELDGEFIFGQLSLMFIQELMTIDVIAEKFISSGLLIALVQAKVSNPIQKGNINIISSPYHRIWVNGILPIFLTTLSKQGPSCLPEICLSIQAFGKQIEACIESWSKDSSSIRITAATIAETSQILFLYQFLDALDVKSYLSSSIHDDSQHTNTIDLPILPGLDSESKRSDFSDRVNNLLKHPNFLTSRIVPSSSEDERIFSNGGLPFEKYVKSLMDSINDFKTFLD